MQSTPISLPFIATGSEGPLHIETTLERRQFEALCPGNAALQELQKEWW